MMKNLSVPLALTLLFISIISAGWGVYYLLDKDTTDLANAVTKIQTSVKEGNWDEARAHLTETLKLWETTGKYWPMLIHHQEMDRIEESMNRMRSYLEYHDSSMSQAELYNLLYYIRHIPEKEQLNLQNIF